MSTGDPWTAMSSSTIVASAAASSAAMGVNFSASAESFVCAARFFAQ